MLSRWRTLLSLCFILAIVGSGVSAASASAACVRGDICLYNGPAFETTPKIYTSPGLHNLAAEGFNDLTSSATNFTNRWAVLWDNVEISGAHFCLRPETSYTFEGISFNNIASLLVVHTFEEGKPPIC
jgi:Peptidase inhibitor family I36